MTDAEEELNALRKVVAELLQGVSTEHAQGDELRSTRWRA